MSSTVTAALRLPWCSGLKGKGGEYLTSPISIKKTTDLSEREVKEKEDGKQGKKIQKNKH